MKYNKMPDSHFLSLQPLLENVLRKYHSALSDLVSDSTNRFTLACKLYSARLITQDWYNCATDNSLKTDIEKGLHLLEVSCPLLRHSHN